MHRVHSADSAFEGSEDRKSGCSGGHETRRCECERVRSPVQESRYGGIEFPKALLVLKLGGARASGIRSQRRNLE